MRQKNVQQQNASTKESIRRNAAYWRSHPVPSALHAYAELQGVRCEESIFLRLGVDYPGMPSLFGLLLTQDGRFIEFEMETDEGHALIECVEVWRDVTSEQNLNPRNPGTGLGDGALALQVLRELNSIS